MSAVAGPSRGPDTWKPTRYLEPNKPDNEEVLEQAAYQAAITRQPGERAKKYKPRKTVDFMGGVLKWRQVRSIVNTKKKVLTVDVEDTWSEWAHAGDTSKSIRLSWSEHTQAECSHCILMSSYYLQLLID